MAAPQNVMLAIHEKKTAAVDLYRPLRHHIVRHYSEREAQNQEDDLESVRKMRSDLESSQPSDALPEVRRDLLQSYYRALTAMESRFPISADRDHINTLSFVWYDAFKTKLKASQQNIQLEKAAVLFNLGAVYSQIGLAADRGSAAGLKVACNSFQAAAGAFAFLRDNAAIRSAVGSSATVDVSPECSGMLERLMLAQAQECFFEKVIGDGKPPGLCSKIARQVSLYYEEAFTALNAPPLSQHFDRSWVSHVQLKSAQFYAEACYRTGLDLHEKEEIALEIARLKSGISALTDAKKVSKGVAAPLLDAVNKLEANLNRNLEIAVKENERVYLMRVPPAGSLQPLPGASLVKSSNLEDVLDASKERLFVGLIPDTSAKALSKYTEMVDSVIREQLEKLQQGSEITRVKLKEMDLPDSILALEGNFSLPADVREEVEAVQVVGGPSGLETEMQQLKDLKRVSEELLVQTEEMLRREEREDSQFRVQFGSQWTRPPSSTLTKNLQDRLNKFAANIKQASDSDARIERAIKDNLSFMAILSCRPIESALPSLSRPIMSLDGNEDAIVGALKQSLRQLEALGAQRASLEDMLKEMKRKDDILPKLMSSLGSNEDLFKKEIAKYEPICEEITQNIEAQEQLLYQIQTQNDEFAAVFNLEDYRAARERTYKQLAAAAAKFREIKENINEGLKFYITLQDAIMNVKQQTNDFVMTRGLQCSEMVEAMQKKMSSLSFSEAKPLASPGYGAAVPQLNNPYRLPPEPLHHPRPTAYARPYPPQQPQPGGYAQSHYQAGPSGMEYGQPAYPGWTGPYYNAGSAQQPVPPPQQPRPPYGYSPSGYYGRPSQ